MWLMGIQIPRTHTYVHTYEHSRTPKQMANTEKKHIMTLGYKRLHTSETDTKKI